jgi:hypothetical protein
MDDLKKTAVKKSLERLNEARKELCTLREADFNVYEGLLGLCKSLGLEVRSPHVSMYNDARNMHLTIETATLKSVGITSLLAFCAEYFGEGESNDYASEYYASRQFKFGSWNEDGITICFEIAADSATCRRVKVGVKMREVAEYKIVCD